MSKKNPARNPLTCQPAAPQPIELSTQLDRTEYDKWLAYVETMTCGPHTIPRGAKIEFIISRYPNACSQWQPACIEPMRSWSSVTFKVNGIEFSDFKTIEFR